MTTAADVMTEAPVTITETSSVGKAARLLDQLAIRHLPVVDAAGELIGMLSDRDLRGALAAADEDLAPSVPPASARVADVMTRDVIVADVDDELVAVAQIMIDARVGAVPIVDSAGRLVGIVSYVDILRALTGVDERVERATVRR
jgi:CBS domain-containing protein